MLLRRAGLTASAGLSCSGSLWTAFTDLGLGPDYVGTGVCLL